MNTKIILALLLLQASWALTINSTGGECSTIGTWNSATKTCSLAGDYSGNIVIEGNEITLEGNGHALQGTGTAVTLQGDSLTVKDLIIKGYDTAINIAKSTNSKILNNVFRDSKTQAVAMGDPTTSEYLADGNLIAENTFYNTQANAYGIFARWGDGLTIRDNTFYGNKDSSGEIVVMYVNQLSIECNSISSAGLYGIRAQTIEGATIIQNNVSSSARASLSLYGVTDAVVMENNFKNAALASAYIDSSKTGNFTQNTIENSPKGLLLYRSQGYTVYHNNFLNNTDQAVVVSPSGDSAFNLDAPVGGNYWSDFACVNEDNDSFCDSAYTFSGGKDNLPWEKMNGWVVVPTPEDNQTETNQTTEDNQTIENEFPFSTFIVRVSAKLEDRHFRCSVMPKRMKGLSHFKHYKKLKKELECPCAIPFEDRLYVRAKFILAPESDGIDPSTENLSLTLGNYSLVLPLENFKTKARRNCNLYTYGRHRFSKTRATLLMCGTEGQFNLQIRGENFAWLRNVNKTTIRLDLGNDFGEKTLTPKVSKHKKIVLLMSDFFDSTVGGYLGGLTALLFMKGA